MVALVRRRRVRGACKERNQSDDSMHPVEPAAGRRSVQYLWRAVRRTRHLCEVLLMSMSPTLMPEGVLDERKTWIRHSYYLALLTAGFHFLQFTASAALWSTTNSAAVASF